MYKKIKTMADVFKKYGLATDFVPNVSDWPESMRQHKIFEFYLQLVIMVINDGWEPNWNNTDERKYYGWWWFVQSKKRVSGRGLSLGVVIYGDARASVGPRLVFQDEARMRHAAKYFLPQFENYYLGEDKAA